MRILYIANLRLPTEKAHGMQIMRMCEAFACREHKVTLLIPFRWRLGRFRNINNIFAYYGAEKSFRIRRLPSADLFPLSRMWPFLDRIFFALQYGTFLASTFLYLAALHRLDKLPDIIYTRDPRIARLARRFTENIFLELHTIPKQDDLAAAAASRGIITVTAKLCEMLLEDAVRSKAVVAPDAADTAAFDAIRESALELRKRLHLPQDAALIGYTGRLRTFDSEKGIPELVEAFSMVLESHPRTRLIVIGGDSEDIQRYQQQIQKGGMGSRIHFISHIPPNSVPRYLKALDVLVAPFPATEHYMHAMSPLKIFEYMAAQKPMVVSDLPSIREILSEKEAFFCKPGDPTALAEAIIEALRKPDEASRKANAAHHLAERYTWQNRADNIERFMFERIKAA